MTLNDCILVLFKMHVTSKFGKVCYHARRLFISSTVSLIFPLLFNILILTLTCSIQNPYTLQHFSISADKRWRTAEAGTPRLGRSGRSERARPLACVFRMFSCNIVFLWIFYCVFSNTSKLNSVRYITSKLSAASSRLCRREQASTFGPSQKENPGICAQQKYV